MFVNRVEVSFDAGHRLLGYPGKCASPHGHTFLAEIFVESNGLSDVDIAVDFGDIKDLYKNWIDDKWDHGFLLNDEDEQLADALRAVPEAKVYLIKGKNPTAEAMAEELYNIRPESGWCVSSVRVWESPKQYAEYRPNTAAREIAAGVRQEVAT